MIKKSILETLSKNLNNYQSTVWLKPETAKLNGETPADLMNDNKPENDFKILPEEIKRIKGKKTNS